MKLAKEIAGEIGERSGVGYKNWYNTPVAKEELEEVIAEKLEPLVDALASALKRLNRIDSGLESVAAKSCRMALAMLSDE